MRHVLASLVLGALLALGVLAPGAGADPIRHFDVTFDIICGGNTLTIISKPGSSAVVTVNGEPSNSVSILVGLRLVDDQGNVVVDFRKPGNQPVQTCTDTSAPPGWTATATTLITPAH
jgi:hypothetical protein